MPNRRHFLSNYWLQDFYDKTHLQLSHAHRYDKGCLTCQRVGEEKVALNPIKIPLRACILGSTLSTDHSLLLEHRVHCGVSQSA